MQGSSLTVCLRACRSVTHLRQSQQQGSKAQEAVWAVQVGDGRVLQGTSKPQIIHPAVCAPAARDHNSSQRLCCTLKPQAVETRDARAAAPRALALRVWLRHAAVSPSTAQTDARLCAIQCTFLRCGLHGSTVSVAAQSEPLTSMQEGDCMAHVSGMHSKQAHTHTHTHLVSAADRGTL